MGFFDNLSKKATETYKNTTDKTSRMAREMKLKSYINEKPGSIAPGFSDERRISKSITVIEVEIKRIYGLGGGFRLCASVLHQGGVNGEFVD